MLKQLRDEAEKRYQDLLIEKGTEVVVGKTMQRTGLVGEIYRTDQGIQDMNETQFEEEVSYCQDHGHLEPPPNDALVQLIKSFIPNNPTLLEQIMVRYSLSALPDRGQLILGPFPHETQIAKRQQVAAKKLSEAEEATLRKQEVECMAAKRRGTKVETKLVQEESANSTAGSKSSPRSRLRVDAELMATLEQQFASLNNVNKSVITKNGPSVMKDSFSVPPPPKSRRLRELDISLEVKTESTPRTFFVDPSDNNA